MRQHNTAPRDDARGGGYPGHWVGRFIWTDGDPYAFHYFLRARREFDLDLKASAAKLHITANDRYILYVNGKYVGRGPARSDCRWKSYDTYDLAASMGRGRNCIAILAYHYGCHNAYTRDDRAGFFAQLEVFLPDGSQQVIGTDETWRVQEARGWRRDVKTINRNVGVSEVYDARAEPVGWAGSGFDDSRWQLATVIPPGASPWSYLEPRQTPLMTEEEVVPVRIVEIGEVLESTLGMSDTDVPERLAVEPHLPLSRASIEHVERLLSAQGSAVVRSAPSVSADPHDRGVRSPYIVLDFGCQVFGFPQLRLSGPAGGVVEMTYGQQLIGGRILPVAGYVRYGEQYVMRDGEQVWRTFEYKQFRYLQIVFRSIDQAVSLDSVSLISYRYPAERRGQFECSDPILTSIWKAAVDTTYLQMEDTIVCDAVRERSSWGGDGAHGQYGVWAGYGDTALCDWHFRLLFRGQKADGMLLQKYPSTEIRVSRTEQPKPPAVYDNPLCIPQHALILAVMLTGEYYYSFGRKELVEDLYPALERLCEWCARHVDATGLLYGLSNWNWMDWTVCDLRGANFQTNAFYYQLLENLADIAIGMGRDEAADLWRMRASKVRGSLRQMHWDPARELYVDSVFEGQQSSVATELSNGLALLYGIATVEQESLIVDHLSTHQSELVTTTPLFIYYVLEGLVSVGQAETAYEMMTSRFERMMTFDNAPTIWESWAPHTLVMDPGNKVSNRSVLPSRAHAGGVGVAWTLSKHVLGIYPDEPGFAHCRIEPSAGSLKWAHGVVPSIRGDIEVAWRWEDQCLSLDVALPEGLPARLVLPRTEAGKAEHLVHNGRHFTIPEGVSTMSGLVLSADRVTIAVSGGQHSLELSEA